MEMYSVEEMADRQMEVLERHYENRLFSDGKVIAGLIDQIQHLVGFLEIDNEPVGSDVHTALQEAKRAIDHAEAYAIRPPQGP